MRTSLSLGRILGFPVDVHFTLLILLAVVLLFGGGVAGVALVALTFASVLAHELGHSVVARRLRVPIAGITLYPFGGVARMSAMPRGPTDEILIAAAGPAVSLALAGGFALPWLVTGLPLFGELATVNAILGLFNLLPALPMDGGRIFRAALEGRMGHLGATRLAATVARWLAAAMGVVGLFTSPMLVLVALVVWFMAGAERRMAEADAVAGALDPDLAAMLAALRARAGGGATRVRVHAARPAPAAADGTPASRMVVDVDPLRS